MPGRMARSRVFLSPTGKRLIRRRSPIAGWGVYAGERITKNSRIIDPSADDGRVSVGVVVVLRYDTDTDTERYLVGSIEERKDGVTVVSTSSPLGEALVGAAVGDVVSFEAPGGLLRVEVVAIEG